MNSKPPPFNQPHCNPKWLRRKRRKELEGELNSVEASIAREKEELEEGSIEANVRAAKEAAVEAYLSIRNGLQDRLRRLKGLVMR